MNFLHKHYPFPFLLFSLGAFISYYISQGFYLNEVGNLMTFSWIINSDWMMHLAQVQAFAHLPFAQVLTNHPLYSGEILSYPFFVNWFSGNLLSLTGNLVFSMTFPLYLGTFFFLFGIYFLSYQLTKNVWVSFLTPFIFFFLAGFQAYYTLQEYSWLEWKTLWDYQYDLDFLVPLGFNWKSFFLTTYLPQRSFLWGMGIGTIVLGLFVQLFSSDENNKITKNHSNSIFIFSQYFLLGLLLGILSIIHTHSFLWFFFLFFFLSLMYLKKFFNFFFLGLGACFTGLPFVYLLLQKKGEVSEFSLFPLSRLGYENFFSADIFSFIANNQIKEIVENISHIFIYWFFNWGIIFCIGLIVCIPFVFKKIFSEKISKLLYPLFILSLFFLFIFSVIQLQGNPWDNTKVHLWSGLFFSLIFSGFIVKIWNINILGKIFSIFFLFISMVSGIIMVFSGINDENEKGEHLLVFSKNDLQNAEKIAEKIPATSLVLTSDYFHHYFAPLTPNSIFMGYRGWIASYGMDYNSKISIAKEIYSGTKNALRLIKENNIDYVLVDNSAQAEYKVRINHKFFHRYFEKIEIDNGSVLYKIIDDKKLLK